MRECCSCRPEHKTTRFRVTRLGHLAIKGEGCISGRWEAFRWNGDIADGSVAEQLLSAVSRPPDCFRSPTLRCPHSPGTQLPPPTSTSLCLSICINLSHSNSLSLTLNHCSKLLICKSQSRSRCWTCSAVYRWFLVAHCVKLHICCCWLFLDFHDHHIYVFALIYSLSLSLSHCSALRHVISIPIWVFNGFISLLLQISSICLFFLKFFFFAVYWWFWLAHCVISPLLLIVSWFS